MVMRPYQLSTLSSTVAVAVSAATCFVCASRTKQNVPVRTLAQRQHSLKQQCSAMQAPNALHIALLSEEGLMLQDLFLCQMTNPVIVYRQSVPGS